MRYVGKQAIICVAMFTAGAIFGSALRGSVEDLSSIIWKRWKFYAAGLRFVVKMTRPTVLVNMLIWACFWGGPRHIHSVLFRVFSNIRERNDLRAQIWNRRRCHLFWGTKHVLIPPSVRCDLLLGRKCSKSESKSKSHPRGLQIWNPRLYVQKAGEPFPSILVPEIECDTSRCELTRMTHFRLRGRGGWILWVGDIKTGAIIPYALREERVAELEVARLCLIPNLASRTAVLRSASAECRDMLRDMEAIVAPQRAEKAGAWRSNWIEEMKTEVRDKGVTPAKKLLRPALVRALRHYYIHGNVRFPRRDNVGIHSVFSEPMARHLNHQLKPLAERVVGRKLRDSSPLVLAYGPRSNLTVHTDHVPFAVSLSVSLGCAKDEENEEEVEENEDATSESNQSISSIFCITWDLSCPVAKIDMRPGDGVLFLGQTIPHYRNTSGTSLGKDDVILSLSMSWHFEEDDPVAYEEGMYAYGQDD